MDKKSSAAQPSKALVPAGQNSTTALDKEQKELQVVGILALPKGDFEKLVKQPPTINIQINNTVHIHNNTQIINNYNGPAPEAPDLGHQGGPREKLRQGPQATASASRAIEGKPHGVKNVPSASSSTQPTQSRSQNGPGDQTQPTQDKTRVEPTVVPPKRPAIDQVRKPASATAPVRQVSVQSRREASQPKKSETLIEKLFHSRPKEKASTSTTTSPAQRSNVNHPSGIREGSSVGQQRKHADNPTARAHGQAPHEPRRHMAPEQPVTIPRHSGSQLAKREEPAVVAQGLPVANKSNNRRTGAGSNVPKALKIEDIKDCLGRLNCRLGNHKSEPNNDPARIILIGKASADEMGLKIDQKTYHIDVVLDLQATGTRLLQTRRCMAQGQVFREFDRPEQDTAWRTFFGTTAHRDKVFENVAIKENCVFNGKYLRAYIMDHKRASEFELRRSADPESDRRTQDTSRKIAAANWRMHDREAPTLEGCRNLKQIRTDSPIPYEAIDKFMRLFNNDPEEKNVIVGT